MIGLLAINPLETVVGIVVWITAMIYHVAAWIFEIFLILASGKVIDSDKYQLLIQNFYIVLGIVVLFFISFSLLRSMVNPDDKKSGTTVVKTSIINLVTSVAILALLPTIFGFLYDFQTSFITRYNVIGRFFGYGNLSEPVDTNDYATWLCEMNNKEIRQGAFQMVNGVYTAFFNVNTEKCSNSPIDSNEKLEECQKSVTDIDTFIFVPYHTSKTFYDAISYVERDGIFSHYIDFTDNVIKGEISFNFLLSIIAGLALIYVGVSYCFDMALRMVKLVFYQIIAPIPIFARVVPDGPLKGSFEKWLKVVVTCYLEVFVRIFVFYFIVYLCKAMLSSEYLSNILLCFGPFMWLLARALLVMGFVMFMRQAPKLISEVTGIDSGNMKLGIMDKLRDGGFFAAGSAIGSFAANRIAGGSVGSALVSAWKGGKDGWKNPSFKSIGAGAATGRAYNQAIENGATARGIRMNAIRGAFGFDTTADAAVRKIDDADYVVKNMSSSSIEYVDENGKTHTILAGTEYNVNAKVAENLKARKAENIGAMSAANEELRALDTKIEYNKKQRGMLSTMEDEADKDFEKGKFLGKVFYSNGEHVYEEHLNLQTGKMEKVDKGLKIQERQVTSEQFKDLQKQGVTFYSDATGSKELSVNDVRGTIRNSRIQSELSSDSGNMTKRVEEEFVTSLERNGGYTYESFNYDSNGIKIVDKDGKALKNSGSFNVKIDEKTNKKVIVQETNELKINSDGTQEYEKVTTEYERGPNGTYSYTRTDRNGNKTTGSIDGQGFAKLFDGASKGYANVLSEEQQEIKEVKLQPREAENKAIDNVIKQHEEAKDAAKQDAAQRAREAEKKYHSNGGK